AAALDRVVRFVLWAGSEPLSEQEVRVAVTPLVPPRLGEMPSIALRLGETVWVNVPLAERGNADSISLSVVGLPEPVTARAVYNKTASGDTLRLQLHAASAASPGGYFLRLSPVADGHVGEEVKLVPLAVEKAKGRRVLLSITAPEEVQLEPGKDRMVKVR